MKFKIHYFILFLITLNVFIPFSICKSNKNDLNITKIDKIDNKTYKFHIYLWNFDYNQSFKISIYNIEKYSMNHINGYNIIPDDEQSSYMFYPEITFDRLNSPDKLNNLSVSYIIYNDHFKQYYEGKIIISNVNTSFSYNSISITILILILMLSMINLKNKKSK